MAVEAHRIVDLQHETVRMRGSTPIKRIPLTDMVAAIVGSNIPSNNTTIRRGDMVVNESETGCSEDNAPLTTISIITGVQRILRPGDTLITETGDSWFNAQRIRLPSGTDLHMQMIYGSIGWSLPATLGCQLARPEGRAILMIGDGSFQMTAQELSTMICFRENSVIIVFNNLGYGIEVCFVFQLF
jgi:pyruvate decarboxylase